MKTNKYIFIQTKTKKIHNQPTCTTRNVRKPPALPKKNKQKKCKSELSGFKVMISGLQ